MPKLPAPATPADSATMELTELRSGGAPCSPLVQPTIRTKFADTALWVGSLTTNEKGEAEVALDMPENLTTWKVKVWGMGHGTKVGARRGRSRHAQGFDRPPASPAVLRREGRSRPLGQCA